MDIVILTAAGVGGATIFGAVIGFLFVKLTEKYADTVISFSAGVMLATSVFNLIIPSVENESDFAVVISVGGIFCGSVCISILDAVVNKLINKKVYYDLGSSDKKEKMKKIILFVSAIAIHNLPEGIAAGVGFGTGNTAGALIIAGSIALQNLPEGMIVISPMLSVGISRAKTFLVAVLTGIIEIAGTLFGYYAVTVSEGILPFALSFAGGTMLYVICRDMIPETQSEFRKESSTYSLISGFCMMLIINNIL